MNVGDVSPSAPVSSKMPGRFNSMNEKSPCIAPLKFSRDPSKLASTAKFWKAVTMAEPNCGCVNVSSTGGLEGVPQMVAYAASKHAITGMTRTAAIELAPHRIRVNSLHPGGVDTAMLGSPEERQSVDYSWMPAGRLADPDEIAKAALYLASDESSYCTGTALLVDGGVMAGPLGWTPPET